MNVKINAVKFRADQKLENFIHEKISKVTSLNNQILNAEVHLKLEKDDERENKVVDIRLDVPGHNIFATKQAKSFEEATVLTIDAIHQQLDKLKTKQLK